MFLFGGSTVILVLEQGRVALDEDILRNSLAGEETIVKMGEKIGTATETALI
jgi:phosphatidylserine decarboxylase